MDKKEAAKKEIKTIDDLLETLKQEELGTIGGGTQVHPQVTNMALRPRRDVTH